MTDNLSLERENDLLKKVIQRQRKDPLNDLKVTLRYMADMIEAGQFVDEKCRLEYCIEMNTLVNRCYKKELIVKRNATLIGKIRWCIKYKRCSLFDLIKSLLKIKS